MTKLMSPADAAKALDISPRALREHVKDGTITFVITGRGKKRPRIKFGARDLEEFEEDRRLRNAPPGSEPCQSIGPSTRGSTSTTSNSNVVAFTALRARRTSATPKP